MINTDQTFEDPKPTFSPVKDLANNDLNRLNRNFDSRNVTQLF